MAEKDCLIAHSVYDEQRQNIEAAMRMLQGNPFADPKDLTREESRLRGQLEHLERAFYGKL